MRRRLMSDLVGRTFTVFKNNHPVSLKVERVVDSIAYCKSLDLRWELRTTTDFIRKVLELQDKEQGGRSGGSSNQM